MQGDSFPVFGTHSDPDSNDYGFKQLQHFWVDLLCEDSGESVGS